MMNKEEEQQHLNKMERIAEQLKDKKQLQAVNLSAGKGGFGDVIIVKDSQREYAIKIISIFDGVDSISKIRLQDAKNEAEVLKNCAHSYIVKYYDEFEIGFNYFILMEKCEMSLQDFVDNNNHKDIPRSLFIRFALQILEAVQYLHSRIFVLRDISLKNILLDSNQNIKLCDFGLAKQINPLLASQAFLTSNIKGVFFYFAPEILDQAKKKDSGQIDSVYQNIEGDIWAVGICLYLLAGASFLDVYSFTKGEEEYLLQKSIDSDINQIIQGILQRDPKSRPSISQIKSAFQDIQNKSKFNKNVSDQKQSEALIFSQSQSSYEQGDYKKSLNLLLLLIEDYPLNDLYKAWIGRVYNSDKQPDKAIYWSQQCLKQNQLNGLAYFNLGNAYRAKQMLEEAISSYKKASEINARDDHTLDHLGLILINKQMYDEVISQAKITLQINPYQDLILYNLGLEYYSKQMYEEAISSFQKALEINPKLEQAFYTLGLIYYMKLMYDEAISSFQKALEINPKLEQALYTLGLIYSNKLMYSQAILSYAKALEINPYNQACEYNIKILSQKLKQI